MENRIQLIVIPQIQKEQFSFRPNHGTLDQVYTPNRALKGSGRFAQPVNTFFADLEKEFDRVPQGILWGGPPGVWGPWPLLNNCSVSDRSRRLFSVHAVCSGIEVLRALVKIFKLHDDNSMET